MKLIFLAASIGFSFPAFSANLDKGVTAFKSGDYAVAFQELHPLAQEGNRDAQSFIGSMYHQSYGVEEDFVKAVKWYRLAAEQGQAEAQNNLAIMYVQGLGVTQDLVIAHMWTELAIAQYDSQDDLGSSIVANQLRRLIARHMSQIQIEQAKSLASECFEKNFKNC